MRVLKVKLRNVKSHKEREFSFSEGVNLIMGPNGAGKTTILQSIFLALLGGDFGKVVDFVRVGESRMSIELEIEHNKEIYKVRRSWRIERVKVFGVERLQAKNEESSLVVNGKKLTNDARRLTKLVEQLFGISKKTLPLLYYGQNEITKLIEMEPSKRKEFIDEIIGIKELEEFGKKLRAVVRSIKLGKIEKYRSLIETLKREVSQKSQIQKEIAELESSLRKKEEELREKEEEFAKLEVVYNTYLQLEAKKSELERKLSEVNREELESKIEKLELLVKEKGKFVLTAEEEEILNHKFEILRYNNYLEELSQIDYSSLITEKEKIEKELKILEEKLSLVDEKLKLETQLREKKRLLGKLNYEISALQEEAKELEARLSAIDPLKKELSEIEEKEKLLERLKDERAKNEAILVLLRKSDLRVCPVCGSHLDDLRRNVLISKAQKIEEELKEIEKGISELEKVVKRKEFLLRKIKYLEALEEQLEKLKKQLKEKELERTNLLKDIAEIKEKLEEINVDESVREKYSQLRERLAKIEEKLKRYNELKAFVDNFKWKVSKERLKEIEQKKEKLNKILLAEKELEYLKSKLRELDSIEKELNQVIIKLRELEKEVDKYNSLKGVVEKLKSEIAEIKGKIAEKRKMLEQLEKKEKQIKAYEEKIEKYMKLVEKLTKLSEALSKDGIPMVLREKLVDYLNEVANIYLQEFTDKYLVKVESDLSIYAIPVENPHLKIEAKNLSGGEKVMFSLSLALALLSWLNLPARFLALDEPTANLDEERAKQLPRLFEKLQSMVDQALIVTHNKELDTGYFNTIRV